MRRNRPSFDLDGRIRQRRHAGDLAVEGAVKLEVARWIRLPRPRWGLIGRAPVRTAGVVEEAEAMRKRAGIDLALLRHIVDMLERRPDPLRPAHRLVDHMKSDQAKCLWQARWSHVRIGLRQRNQRIHRVEFPRPDLVRIEDLPRYLDHDGAGTAFDMLVGVGVLPGRKIDREPGPDLLPLAGLTEEMLLGDVVEHRLVHQDVEQRVVPVLVDQGAGLERLIERLLDHLDDHHAGLVLRHAGGGHQPELFVFPCFFQYPATSASCPTAA
jgi:hypothetical protein